LNEGALRRNTDTIFLSFPPALQSTKMMKKQTKSSRLQAARKKKQVEQVSHDTEATDDVVDSPDRNDKEPDPPKDSPDTKEKTPVPPDENRDSKGKKQTADEDNEPPTVPDRDGAINVGKPTGVAVGDNSPFAIDHTKTDERVDTTNVSNVDNGVDRHVNDGDESNIPKGTDDDQLLDAVIPQKKPSRLMVPEAEVR
jgi:hypothetical protein